MRKHLFVSVAGIVSMAVVLFSAASCSNSKSRFLHQVKEFSFNENERVLTGVPTGLEYEGFVEESLIIDSLLICQVEEPEGYINVYRLSDFSLKTTLCPLGRARNEFSFPFKLLTQYYQRDGETFILVVDKANYVKEINLSQSLAQGTTVVSDMAETPSFYDNHNVLYLNNNIRQLFKTNHNEQHADDELYLEYWVDDKVNNYTKKIDVFSKPMEKDDEGVNDFSYGAFIKHPQKNLFAQPCQLMDYIIYFDIDNDKVFAVHREGKPTFDDLAPDGRHLIYSRYTFATSDYVLANYLVEVGDDKQEYYLLVFDWEGNFKCGAKYSPSVLSFVYDEKQNVLYGWEEYDPRETATEKLYKFDLNGFLN